MRSKLLSLHLIHTILVSHPSTFQISSTVLFTSSTSQPLFIHAIKQYLCLSLSRNAASVVPQVFDTAMEIFNKILTQLRTHLKKELSVIFTEIVIPIIEARSTTTFHQRTSMLKSLYKCLSDPVNDGGRILVEIYLNYDCDVEAGARENIWERLIGATSKVMTTLYSNDSVSTAFVNIDSNGIPAITTATLTSFTKEQVKELYSSSGDYFELKKRGLEVLVRGVLNPLVVWCLARISSENVVSAVSEKIEDDSKLEFKDEDLKVKIGDDPMAFKNKKHRKQIMIEGVKRFNQKPKRGIQFFLENEFIPARTSREIAKFLLNTDGLNKTMIGEFLGEGYI